MAWKNAVQLMSVYQLMCSPNLFELFPQLSPFNAINGHHNFILNTNYQTTQISHIRLLFKLAKPLIFFCSFHLFCTFVLYFYLELFSVCCLICLHNLMLGYLIVRWLRIVCVFTETPSVTVSLGSDHRKD